VGHENSNPLAELARLEQETEHASTLEELKPVFARLDQMARQHSDDLELQLAVDDLKRKVVDRGKFLRETTISPVRIENPPPNPPPVVESAAPDNVPASPPLPTTKTIATPARQRVNPAIRWKQPLFVGMAAALIVLAVLTLFFVNQARRRTLATALVPVQVVTLPPGASVRVNSEPQCTSDCRVSLPPGKYQIAAFLDGYEPAASEVTITPGKAASLNLTLQPAPQTIRILTDLAQGTVSLDDQPPSDLQDGQFTMEQVPPGMHTLKVASKTGQATFNVEISDAKLPVIAGPVAVKNLMAVLVSTVGRTARVVTSSGPLKLALNGQPQADATPEGVDLTGYEPGIAELLVGEGRDQRNMKETFSPAPALTAFLKSDLNIGTLIVATGEDDVHVFLNNKEYPRRTQRGQVRVPTIGAVNVRVSKDGFETEAPQTAEIKKGSEVRLDFKMRPLPRVASLQIRGATPGAEVLLDQKSLGTIGGDGTFTNSAVPPGDHIIELRREAYLPKRTTRAFRAGQVVTLSGVEESHARRCRSNLPTGG